MTIRVLVADDQEMIRAGFRLILSAESDIEVVGEASTGTDAVSMSLRLAPEVVLMDIRMPGLDGIAATRAIARDPRVDARVLVLTTFDRDDYLFEALVAGASGFLLKDATSDELVGAIRTIAQGDAMLSPAVTRRVVAAYVARGPQADAVSAVRTLSARELEVLRLMADGRSNGEIAADLVVAEATVKTHVSSILLKLQARDRVGAVIIAHRSGLADGILPDLG